MQERPLLQMAKGQLRFTPMFWRWQTTGRETSGNNE